MADTDDRDEASATKFVLPFTYLISEVNNISPMSSLGVRLWKSLLLKAYDRY